MANLRKVDGAGGTRNWASEEAEFSRASSRAFGLLQTSVSNNMRVHLKELAFYLTSLGIIGFLYSFISRLPWVFPRAALLKILLVDRKFFGAIGQPQNTYRAHRSGSSR